MPSGIADAARRSKRNHRIDTQRDQTLGFEAMDRRTFLNRSDLAKAATSAARSMSALTSQNYAEAHALMEEAQAQMLAELGAGAVVDKTAVSRKIRPHAHTNLAGRKPDPHREPLDLAFDLPHGFIPTHVDSTFSGPGSCYELEIIDDEGCVLRNFEDAFNNGALQLWRPVFGKLRAKLTYVVPLSCLPEITITIYGSLARA